MSRAKKRPVPGRSSPAPGPQSPPLGHGDLEASLVLIFPLLLAYELGVLFAGRVNGVDVVTRALYAATGGRTGYLIVHAVIAALFLAWIRRGNRWGTLRLGVAAPVILEAALYALTLGAVVTLVISRLLGLGAAGAVVDALGAGVHEEIVFRLALLGGLVELLRSVVRRGAVPIAMIGSALVFAAAHHIGPGSEPYSTHAFAFRTGAGLVFGAIFWYRSLAHAVYAHVLYDLLVAL